MEYRKARILIVDDEEGIRSLMRGSLEAQGYQCFEASDGLAALEVLAREPIDLALTDIMMPGMTGVQFFQEVRQRGYDVGIVFVTAINDLNIAADNLKEGPSITSSSPYPESDCSRRWKMS